MLTNKEKEILKMIIEDDYQNCGGQDVINNSVWFDCTFPYIFDFYESEAFNNLLKNKLVGFQNDDDGDLVWITKKGYNAYYGLLGEE